MPDATARGRFAWHELMTTDTKSAVKFFTTVVGWKSQSWEQDPSYTVLTAKGVPMAGIMSLGDQAKASGTPPSWITYIYTPDVDETCREAASLGANVVKSPTDIPNIGRFAVIQDPQGAAFSVITPTQAPGAESAPVVGDFSWHELATTDSQAAFSFYQQLFGWQETSSMDMGPGMGTYQMFGRNGVPLGGIYNKMSQQQGPPAWLPYIKVPDAKKTAVTIKKLGAVIANGPMEVPGGDWIVVGADLQGAMFAVHSSKPAARKAVAKSKTKRTRARKSTAKRAAVRRAATVRGAKRKAAKKVARKKIAKKKVAKKKVAVRRKVKAAKRRARIRRSR